MNNNRGFATIGVLVAIMIATMIVITLFLNPIISTTIDIKNSKVITPNYVNNMNGIERVYSTFYENISHNKDIIFEDINKEYSVSEANIEHSQINLTLDYFNDTFYINNKTDVNIYFEVSPIDPEESHSYNIDLTLNGSKSVASQSNLVNNTTIEVPASFLYNEDTSETNYGEYKLSIDTNNCHVVAKVQYDKLNYREVNISNSNIEQTLVIDNEDEENVEIYFMK